LGTFFDVAASTVTAEDADDWLTLTHSAGAQTLFSCEGSE